MGYIVVVSCINQAPTRGTKRDAIGGLNHPERRIKLVGSNTKSGVLSSLVGPIAFNQCHPIAAPGGGRRLQRRAFATADLDYRYATANIKQIYVPLRYNCGTSVVSAGGERRQSRLHVRRERYLHAQLLGKL